MRALTVVLLALSALSSLSSLSLASRLSKASKVLESERRQRGGVLPLVKLKDDPSPATCFPACLSNIEVAVVLDTTTGHTEDVAYFGRKLLDHLVLGHTELSQQVAFVLGDAVKALSFQPLSSERAALEERVDKGIMARQITGKADGANGGKADSSKADSGKAGGKSEFLQGNGVRATLLQTAGGAMNWESSLAQAELMLAAGKAKMKAVVLVAKAPTEKVPAAVIARAQKLIQAGISVTAVLVVDGQDVPQAAQHLEGMFKAPADNQWVAARSYEELRWSNTFTQAVTLFCPRVDMGPHAQQAGH